MTHEEANDKWNNEIFRGGKVDHEALRRLSNQLKEEQRDKDFGKAIELWMAGWTSEPLGPKAEIMSWYWRRPARPGRKKGRLFLSTDQAIRFLRKEKGLPPPEL